MKTDLKQALVGLSTEHRQMEYNWRDMALYALSVGAKADDLMYTYEKNMKALPSFGVLPYWGTVNITPRIARPDPAAMMADRIIKSTIAPLHMEHEIVMHKPIDPIKGTFVFQDVITDVYDRGEGKGAVIRTQVDIFDDGGNPVCTNYSNTLFQEGGGFGGEPMPKNTVQIPDGTPDVSTDDHMSDVQNVLYRLAGDTNLVHVDPDFAKERGFDRVFMQGLCSFGFACRMLIDGFIKGEPERMTRMAVQMRSIAYPGDDVRLVAWKEADGKAVFQLQNPATGKPILDKGVFEWK